MKDEMKTKSQLIQELEDLRQQVASQKGSAAPSTVSRQRFDGEENFKFIFQNAPEAYFLMDLKGNILDGNKASEKLLGYRRNELVGKNINVVRLLPPEMFNMVRGFLDSDNPKKTTGPDPFTLIHKKGHNIPVEILTHLLNIQGRNIMLGIVMDRTEKEKSRTLIEESETRYRTLFNNASDYIYILDPQNLKNPVIVDANKAVFNAHGLTRNEVVGKPITNLLAPESQKKVKESAGFLASGGILSFEAVHIRKNGTEFYVDFSGRMVPVANKNYIIALERDITERKKSEAALKEEERRYHDLFELSPSGILLEDAQGKILDVNLALCKLLGYSKSELLGKNVRMLVPPGIKVMVEENIDKLLAGEYLTHVAKTRRKDGRILYMSLNEKMVSLSAGSKGILSIAEDISESKAAENLLRESEEKYRQLIDNSLVGIYITQKHILKFCNYEFARIFGYNDPEEITGTHIKKLVKKESWDLVDKEVKLRESGSKNSSHYEFYGVCKDGTEVEVEILGGKINYNGTPAIQGILIDITHRKKAERALHQLNLQYETFIQNSLVGIWQIEFSRKINIDLPAREVASLILNSGYFSVCNDAMAKMYGYKSNKEMVNRRNAEFSVDSEKSIDHLELFVKNNFKVELRDSEESDINGRIHHFRNSYFGAVEAGELKWLWGVQIEITEQRRLEAQLRQSQKMEAVGTLAGGIAHDFNNLLTVINGHADLGLMKLESEHPAHRDIVSILQAGKRAESLTRQLLAFGRKQLQELQIVDINQLITGFEKMVQRLIGEDIKTEINLRPDISAVKADVGQIEQILMNLVINARDAINTRKGESQEKRIIIKTDQIFLDADFVEKNEGSRGGMHILISVKDNGSGLSEEVKSKMFEPFFTTKEPGKGTGLGLATVYGIVKQNNASVYATCDGDGLTSFDVYWPVAEKLQIAEEKRVESKEKYPGHETIFLVEDDEGVRNYALAVLKGAGYTVQTASDGKEALEKLKASDSQFDLLITDLVMPNMSGQELSARIKKLFPGIRILCTSGYTEDHIISTGEITDDVNFIQKPFSAQAVLKKIRQILDK